MQYPSFSGIRRRVEKLATDVRLARCGGSHTRHKISHIHGDEPVPVWPEAASGERCACGRTLKYVHIVHQHLLGPLDRLQG